MSKSKAKFIEEQDDLFQDLVGEDSEVEAGYHGKAIYPMFNKDTKKYEYLYIYIDENSKSVVKTEVFVTRFEHEYQIEHDISKYFADFFTKNKKS
jgi:hypothetical protein